jgi:hypothetical protein
MNISAILSAPRLTFSDNMSCALVALSAHQIPLRISVGVFWGRQMTSLVEAAIEAGHAWLLVVEYDVVFDADDVAKMCSATANIADIDALASICPHRSEDRVLLGREGGITHEELQADIVPVESAHFGFTLFRLAAFDRVPQPWFSDDGNDPPDMRFWRRWRECGNKIHCASRVSVGHMELTIRWPSPGMKVLVQPIHNYRQKGKPQGIWK